MIARVHFSALMISLSTGSSLFRSLGLMKATWPPQPLARDCDRVWSGRAYANNRDKELEGMNGFLAALKSSEPLKKAFTGFQLDSVQRGRFKEEEVTEFQLSCISREGR